MLNKRFKNKRNRDKRKPIALDMARTPNTLAPFQFMTFPPSPSILMSSNVLNLVNKRP